MAHVAKRNPNRCPTHPGALLREDVIPATGKTKAEIAQLLGISRRGVEMDSHGGHGAPRSLKMGNIRSPRRYDGASDSTQ